ncbi:Transposase IS4 [Popillia japonica]|uniref:Transposase IS4 n=1 Tax=Popillia japonica TaxID=7064 RepID=A0AAW1LSS0_POPJA
MGDYEDEQRRLQQLWESCMSDEESEFPDVYLSDNNGGDQSGTIQSVIEDVVANYSIEDDAEIASAIASNNLNWGPIDGTSLKRFDFTEPNSGIKAEFYEYYNKQPYDFFKLFVTDEIINDMVYQTNLYAEQVLKETQKTKGHVKEWVPTNNQEIETFFGVILWMGLMKLPRLKAYWSTNILYANKVKEVMPRNRFEQLLRMWHFNNNEDKEFANDRVRKLTPLLNPDSADDTKSEKEVRNSP